MWCRKRSGFRYAPQRFFVCCWRESFVTKWHGAVGLELQRQQWWNHCEQLRRASPKLTQLSFDYR